MFSVLLLLSVLSPIPPASRQLVLVLTDGTEVTSGVLTRFERETGDSAWTPVGQRESWPIVVGRSGLASGLGLHRDPVPGLPVKIEGDGKSPAGVFALTESFGFASTPPPLRLPYFHVADDLECIDDPESDRYNQILKRSDAQEPDWKSSERMREIEGYEWGVVIAQNTDPIRKRGGSCVFFHVWSGPERATLGCTAMEVDRMRELIAWLDRDESPVLVQLTEDAFESLRDAWKLPRPYP
jgi:D-alanyl-D-alanine dipeptidase